MKEKKTLNLPRLIIGLIAFGSSQLNFLCATCRVFMKTGQGHVIWHFCFQKETSLRAAAAAAESAAEIN